MKYKTLRGISKLMAQFNQQDVAKLEDRHIWDERDFTDEDNRQILLTTNKLIQVFKNANNKNNSHVLEELQQVVPTVFIGSDMQDQYIATCKHNGINIMMGIA